MAKLNADQVASAIRYNVHQDDEESFISGLQEDLAVPVTGEWDEQTVQAVASYQAKQGLSADGKVGPRTRAAIAATVTIPASATVLPAHAITSRPSWATLQAGILAEARAEWGRGTSEQNKLRTGPLAAIFRDSGWSRYGVDLQRGKTSAKDWCGMTVASWYYRNGLHPDLRKSFFATENVRSFYSYRKSGNVHHRTAKVVRTGTGPWQDVHAWHASQGSSRTWVEGLALRALAEEGLTKLPLVPGATLLIAHNGSTSGAQHIALVESFDGQILTTLEGNATGVTVSGTRQKDSVVRLTRDLTKKSDLHDLFGIGTPSECDFVTVGVEYA